ncbi:permease, partial [Pseudomonas sp. FW306-2-11AD]
AMTDQQFVAWSNKLITTIACYYIAYGGWLLVRTPVLAAFTKGGLQ